MQFFLPRNQHLLHYKQPKLLAYVCDEKIIKKRHKNEHFLNKILKNFINAIYFPICAIIGFFCSVFVIDSINTPITNGLMTYVYGFFDFVLPDSELFVDSSEIGFVSSLVGGFETDLDFQFECFKNIVVYDEISVSESCLQYVAFSNVQIFAPCDAIVGPISYIDGENSLILQFENDSFVIISGKIIFAVQEETFIKAGDIIGANYGDKYPITFKIYKNNKLCKNLLTEFKWAK